MAEKILTGTELSNEGILHEANRLFFHPIGLRIEASPAGVCRIVEVAPGDNPVLDKIDPSKVVAIASRAEAEAEVREKDLGFVVQPVLIGDEEPDQSSGELTAFQHNRMRYLVRVLPTLAEDRTTTPIPEGFEGRSVAAGKEIEHPCQLGDEERLEVKDYVGNARAYLDDPDSYDSILEAQGGPTPPELLARMEELFGLAQPGMKWARSDPEERARVDALADDIQAKVEAYREGLSETEAYLSNVKVVADVSDPDTVYTELLGRLTEMTNPENKAPVDPFRVKLIETKLAELEENFSVGG